MSRKEARGERSDSSSAYREAIRLTSQTIAVRARYFRNLVIAVVLVGTISLGWAAFGWTLAPLAGLSLLLPLCGVAFLADARLLNDWRSQLAGMWTEGRIQIRAFVEAVSANPTLPEGTLKSMLATLPIPPDQHQECLVSPSTREVVAAVCLSLFAYRADVLALLACGYFIVSAAVIAAAAARAWEPLLGIALALLLLPIRISLKRWRLKSASRKTRVARASCEFNRDHYAQTLSSMSEVDVAAWEKDYFAAS